MSKPLAEVLLPYRGDAGRPVGTPLLAYGGARAVLLLEGELNRAGMAKPGSPFSDYDRSHPPDPAALASIAPLLKAGRPHTILHLETVPSLRELVTAAQVLRKHLARSALLSLGTFPGVYTPADEAWADAAAVVDCPCWNFYPWNEVARRGKDYWLGEVDAAGKQLKKWFPRRSRKIAYLTPTYQIWWADQPQYADLLPMQDKPVPLDWWRAVLEKLRDEGWQVLLWGFQAAEAVAAHVLVVAEVFGLVEGD